MLVTSLQLLLANSVWADSPQLLDLLERPAPVVGEEATALQAALEDLRKEGRDLAALARARQAELERALDGAVEAERMVGEAGRGAGQLAAAWDRLTEEMHILAERREELTDRRAAGAAALGRASEEITSLSAQVEAGRARLATLYHQLTAVEEREDIPSRPASSLVFPALAASLLANILTGLSLAAAPSVTASSGGGQQQHHNWLRSVLDLYNGHGDSFEEFVNDEVY